MGSATLIAHGDDGRIVPVGASGLVRVKLVPGTILMVSKGGDHGLPTTHRMPSMPISSPSYEARW